MSLLIATLKEKRRWVLWRLETVHGKLTKVPYQPGGAHAASNRPATWSTYADCDAVVSQFSGVGLVLGDGVWGVDIDACCDASTGKFSASARDIVIGLDSYGEYSPSGTGAHVLGLGTLPGLGLKKAAFGLKSLEVKSEGFYFTFTGRHLSKTPLDLMDRQDAISALYERVSKVAGAQKHGLSLTIAVSEEERLKKLMLGDMSDYKDDHSTADYALCVLLAKQHGGNAFKIDEQFRKSGLYREKWERDDYRENTITRAANAVAKEIVQFADEDEDLSDDRELEYVVSCWFPKGEVSLIGAPSGAGKTSFALNLCEAVRLGGNVWGHPAKARDYRVISHDRSKRGVITTVRSLGLPVAEVLPRIIRLTTRQQLANPVDVFGACLDNNPGVEVWLIEGLDLWIPDMNKMSAVGPILDGLQRLATRHDVALIASVGAPKQKGKDRYTGRDALFGSGALARKSETIVTIGWSDDEDQNSVRKVVVMPRTGASETLFFTWLDGKFALTAEPNSVVNVGTDANRILTKAIVSRFSDGSPVKYAAQFGPERTFYRWQKWAADNGLIHKIKNRWFLQDVAVAEFMAVG